MKKVINECTKIGWIDAAQTSNKIRVSPYGLEMHSVSYLIFGHDYARKVWTGVIVAVVGWFIIYTMESKLLEIRVNLFKP